MSKSTKKKHPNEPRHPEAQGVAPEAEHEDVVLVPKGQSRGMYLFTLGLLVFVLIIFTVGGLFEQTAGGLFGGGGEERPGMTFVEPGSNTDLELSLTDFTLEKRMLDRMMRAGFYRRPQELMAQARNSVTDEETATFLLLEHEALAAGIMATDKEVSTAMSARFGTSDQFLLYARSNRTTSTQLQEEIRRALVVDKYKNMLTTAVAVADPSVVEERWGEQHQEYSFEYVEVEVEGYQEEAAQEVPGDEELLDWFHALPEFQQRQYYTEETYEPQLSWIPLDGSFDGSALIAAWPRPEEPMNPNNPDADPDEDLARSYYNQFSNVRFRNELPEEPDPADEGEDDEAEPEDPPPLIQPFEDVREQALAEAELHASLSLWLTDLSSRASEGAEIDFAAEAAALGLPFEDAAGALTRADLEDSEVAPWRGRFVAGQIAFAREDSFLPRVILEEGAMVVARLVRKVPGEEPPFDEIREEVAEEWAKEHAAVIAVRALSTLREGLVGSLDSEQDGSEEEGADEAEAESSSVDSAAFQAAASAAGLEVQTRDWLEQREVPGGDFGTATPAQLFLSITAELYDLEPGELAEPQENVQGTHAFLVRMVGKRTADASKMKPQDLTSLRAQLERENVSEFERAYLSAGADHVRRRYGLSLAADDYGDDAPEE